MMRIVKFHCAGIDVHKKFIAVCIATTDFKGVTTYKKKKFRTFNSDLKSCRDWLLANNCTEVCMESTGKYWIPVFNILETDLKVVLANPKYIRSIKGKKTDDKDAMWIADLFKFDIVPSSYIPNKEIRKLRELSRYRQKLVGARSAEKMRLQNSLTVSNIALASVLTDSFGKSASSIIDYLINGESFDPEHCKSLLLRSAKKKADEVVASIVGYDLSNDQALKMKLCREHVDYISQVVSTLDDSISKLAHPYDDLIRLAVDVPGITENSARYIIAEIGADMTVFSTSKHLCSWAGLTPQNNESAGKKKSSRVSRAGVYLKPLLVQCALASIKDKSNTYFRVKYDRIKKRRGHKKAIIAIARMLLTCLYHMFLKKEAFQPTDINYDETPQKLVEKNKQQYIQRAIKLLEKEGHTITPPTAA
jgi:transposase